MLQVFAILIAEKRIWDVEIKLLISISTMIAKMCRNDSIDPNSDQSFQKPGIKDEYFACNVEAEEDREEAQL